MFFTGKIEPHFGDNKSTRKISEEGESAVEERHDIYQSARMDMSNFE